jgi:hypothetical protein
MKTWSTLFLLFLFFLSFLLPSTLSSRLITLETQAQTTSIRIPITVINASLPVTIGIPIAEATNILDPSQLGVTDANGVAVPSQIRVLARWRGVANDISRPVKWLLVDFKPATNGAYFLTRAPQVNFPPVTNSDAGDGIRVTNSQIEIELPKQGEGLVRSFKLAGREMLRAPVAVRAALPRRAIITKPGSSSDTVIVTDAMLLKAGDVVRFEHVDTLKWDAPAGSSRLVTNEWNFSANRRYRIDEDSAQQEEIEVSTAQPQDLQTATALKFNHPAGAAIRDLSIEQEVATIKSINGQTVQFTAPLKSGHVANEKIFVPNAANKTATAVIERTVVEETNSLRAVVRQDGSFRSDLGKTPPTVAFTLRYYVYANQPFVRVRLRLMNNGTFGFGASRSMQPPFAEHAILRSLSVAFPTVASGSGVSQVLNSGEARELIAQRQSGASLTAGLFEVAVPEFVENYPKALRGDSNGIRFDILPDTGSNHIFDGARAKTTDFYIGQQTINARALTNAMNAKLDPAYVASTGAVRPAMVEKRNWPGLFAKDEQMSEAATRVERMFASAYAVEATDAAGAVPATSIFEYRNRGENGEQFGWRNFGDLAWGDGYANVHYDLPFVLLREYLRTGDARAFQLGGEMARYRADWGHYRADDFLTVEKTWNFRGLAFYEKGDHGTYKEPVPSHSWIEGMWLYWAMTGDAAVRESAVEGSDAFLRMNFTYANALGWNEPRWLGWPTHGLMIAYRYTGDNRYLNKARENINLLLQTEESFGKMGHYISRGSDVIRATQPWAWCYSQLGVIEYWRETGDRRVADYLVRIADWLINKENPPLKPGLTLDDGTYLPGGISYFWSPDKIAEDRSVALAGLALPVLTAAARITNRADLWARVQQVFRDYAFYRDLPEGRGVAPATRHIINFRSLQFPASVTKVYGQMGLTVSEFLPELMGSVVLPGKLSPPPATLAPAPTPPPTPPARTPSPNSPPPAGSLANVAFNRPATASSVRVWSDVIGAPGAANDGLIESSGKASVWHSDSNTGRPEWWQVDLGQPFRIASIEIVFRNDQDQPVTRRNFDVLASNDPSFNTSARLGHQGDRAVQFKHSWKAEVSDANSYRYIRVQKTMIDRDAYGQSFFVIAEVRIFAPRLRRTPESPVTSSSPKLINLTELKPQKLIVGQSLSFTLAMTDDRGIPVQLSAFNLPDGAAFDSKTGRFLFTPNSMHAGNVYQIAFRAMNEQTDKLARMDVAIIIDGAPNIMLLTPSSSISAEKPTTISWSSSSSAQIVKYQIRLSTDGGASYPMILAELPGSASQYQWTIPKNFPVTSRSQLRVMIKATDAHNRVGVDFSKQDLRITK